MRYDKAIMFCGLMVGCVGMGAFGVHEIAIGIIGFFGLITIYDM